MYYSGRSVCFTGLDVAVYISRGIVSLAGAIEEEHALATCPRSYTALTLLSGQRHFQDHLFPACIFMMD